MAESATHKKKDGNLVPRVEASHFFCGRRWKRLYPFGVMILMMNVETRGVKEIFLGKG